MENIKSEIELLFERVADYVETKLNLLKLKAIDKSADIISSLITALITVVIALTVFFVINIGIAFWLGDLLGKIYYGFFIVAGFYAIIGLIIHFSKRSITKAVCNSIIKKIFN